MAETFDEAPDVSSAVPPQSGLPVLLLKVLGGIGITLILISLLLPATRQARPAARRSACKNNLKQIGLALHNYADKYGAFPPAYTVDRYGNPLHSWRTLILPYIDYEPLYNTIDLSVPWDDPVNAEAVKASISTFHCPGTNPGADLTTYLAVVGPNSCLRPDQPRRFSEITDGLDHTLAIVEVPLSSAVHWMSPMDADEDLVLSFAKEAQLPHNSGTHGLFADGHVDFIAATTPADRLRALMTVAGREKIADE